MSTNVADIIRRKALQYGVDPTTALAFAQIESGLNPSPKTGNGGGLYQLDNNWWNQYGNGQNINDPSANADAFMRYYKGSLLPGMTAQLGRQPTPGELYLGHQQGVAGAGALLQNPNGIAADTVSPFYNNVKTATSAITGNGGQAGMSGADFANMWNDRLNTAARSFDPNWAGSNSAIIGTPNQPAMMVADAQPQPTITKVGSTPTPQSKGFDFKGLLGSGLQQMAAAQPSTQMPQGPQAQAVRGDLGLLGGMTNPLDTPGLNKQQQLAGLLGIG